MNGLAVDMPLFVTNQVAADVAVTIKAAGSQTGDLLNITDSSDSALLQVASTGHLNNINGMRTVTTQYGAGLGVQLYGENTPEHVNQAGWYDHTGHGSGEKVFVKTSGDDFTQADADNSNWILFTSGAYPNAMCEIKQFINATTVIVDGLGWDQDINSSGSPGNFLTIKHPSFVTGDGGKHEFSVGADGEFEIASYAFTGGHVAEIELDAAVDNTNALIIENNANGYNSVSTQNNIYISGDVQPGDVGSCYIGTINDVEASSADATTLLAAFAAVSTAASDATTTGLVVLSGFTNALVVQGSPAIDPDYGYENTSGTSVDRVNSGGGGNDAFLEASAVDVTLFENDDDYILIGSDGTFEDIQVILDTNSSKDIEANFFYSKAGGNWTALVVAGDGTNGMQTSGNIIFTAPGDWTKDDEDMDGNPITDAYYVAIQRTRGPVIVTLPVESYFKTFASQETGMSIDGGGFVKPRSAVDASAPNNSIYYSTTQSKLVYKDSGGSVNDLY